VLLILHFGTGRLKPEIGESEIPDEIHVPQFGFVQSKHLSIGWIDRIVERMANAAPAFAKTSKE
jgi:hypothetical protein